MDLATVGRIRSYIAILKQRHNEEALDWRRREVFVPEVFEALEAPFSFFPKEPSPEEMEFSFRKELLANQELTHDLLNSIDDLLRKIVKMMAGKDE